MTTLTLASSGTETPQPTVAESDLKSVARLKTFAAWVLVVLGLVAFAASTPGLVAAGELGRLGKLAWAVPLVVDGGLVFMAVAGMIRRAETGRVAVLPAVAVAVLTAVSVGA
jgi:hypothetical protein